MVYVMNCIRMIRQDMVTGGQTETESSAEEEKAKDEPVVRAGVGIVLFDVRVIGNGKRHHPQCRQEMAVYVTGLVVEVEAAPKGIEI